MTDVPSDTTDLVRRFHRAMIDVYRRAKGEARYNATYFLRMVDDRGGLAAAQSLLVPGPSVPEGLTQLHLRGRLDISMEALVLLTPWCSLFTPEELQTARRRWKSVSSTSKRTWRSTAAAANDLFLRSYSASLAGILRPAVGTLPRSCSARPTPRSSPYSEMARTASGSRRSQSVSGGATGRR